MSGSARGDARPELEDVPRGPVLRTMLVIVTVGGSLCFATYLIMRASILRVRPSYRFPERSLPAPRNVAGVRAEPFRIANPAPTIEGQQRAVLGSYGWVDPAHRIVRIPIDRAIEVMARRQTERRP